MNKKIIITTLAVILITIAIGFTVSQSKNNNGEIYLYGEMHAITPILDKEAELWKQYYHEQGMRHLFIEDSYAGAELLNVWMQSDNDKILDKLWDGYGNSLAKLPQCKEFVKKIKQECPKTIFHGTDIEFNYDTTGEWFLEYLREQGQENSEKYKLTQQNIEQGKYYRNHPDDVYRENSMAENFQKAFEKLGNESIMGIYGGAHTGIGDKNYETGTVPNMASQINAKYKGRVYTEDLSKNYDWDTPWTEEYIHINEKQYKADYFGEHLTDVEGEMYNTFEIWQLKEGAEDFESMPLGEEKNIYPWTVYYGKIWVIDYNVNGEFTERKLYRSDSQQMSDGTIAVREILIE